MFWGGGARVHEFPTSVVVSGCFFGRLGGLVVACDCLSSGEDAVEDAGVSVGGCEFVILAAVGPL